jgi:hypothetical protein
MLNFQARTVIGRIAEQLAGLARRPEADSLAAPGRDGDEGGREGGESLPARCRG